jgi:hypothetical protein
MARGAGKSPVEGKTSDFSHDGKRKLLPQAGVAAEGRSPAVPPVQYALNPHLPPTLRFDPTGQADGVEQRVRWLAAEAGTQEAHARRSRPSWWRCWATARPGSSGPARPRSPAAQRGD